MEISGHDPLFSVYLHHLQKWLQSEQNGFSFHRHFVLLSSHSFFKDKMINLVEIVFYSLFFTQPLVLLIILCFVMIYEVIYYAMQGSLQAAITSL